MTPTSKNPDSSAEGTYIIDKPDQLIAEVPALLHFVPAAPSLVIFGSSRRGDGAETPIMRFDIPEALVLCPHFDDELTEFLDDVDEQEAAETISAELAATLRADVHHQTRLLQRLNREFDQHIESLAVSQQLDHALVLLLFPHCCDPCDIAMEATDVFAQRLKDLFEDANVACTTVLCVECIAANSPWRFADSDELYEQLDPKASQLAAESVMQGRQIHSQREDIAHWFAQEDGAAIAPSPLDKRGVLPTADVEKIAASLIASSRSNAPAEKPKSAATKPDSLYDDAVLEFVGARVCSPAVFDYLIKEIADEETPRAVFGADPWDRELLLQVARRTTGRSRAAALLLLGVLHYLEGQGVHAAECFEQARGGAFHPSFCEFVRVMVLRGEPPQQLRAMVLEILEPIFPLSA